MALVAHARRELLLRVHRHRLRHEDLEDCYAQATLELVTRARSGTPFSSAAHVANALEQKFVSRVHDRRRALGGRSSIEAALADACSLDAWEDRAAQIADPTADVEALVSARVQLARIEEVAAELSHDQRLLLAHQVGQEMGCLEFCQRFGWSSEKFRKVAQRARVHLKRLVVEYDSGERCRRIEPALLALVARVGDAEQIRRAESHLSNCASCRERVRQLRWAERSVLGIGGGWPLGLSGAGTAASFGASGAGGAASVGLGSASAGGGAGTGLGAGAAAGGAAAGVIAAGPGTGGGAVAVLGGAGLGAVKLGVSALCLASLAGGGLLCVRGVLARRPSRPREARSAVAHRDRRVHQALSSARPVPAPAAGRVAVPAVRARVVRSSGGSAVLHASARQPPPGREVAAAREFASPRTATRAHLDFAVTSVVGSVSRPGLSSRWRGSSGSSTAGRPTAGNATAPTGRASRPTGSTSEFGFERR